MYLYYGNPFGHTRMVLLGNVCQVKLVSVRCEIVLVLVQDRCTVCTECTTCMVALGTPEWYFEVMYVEWKLVLVHIEIVLVSA